MILLVVSSLFSAMLSQEQLMPISKSRDSYTPAAAYGGGKFLMVWQSGRILPGDLRNGPNYQSDLVACRVNASGELLDQTPFVIADTIDLKQLPRVAYGTNIFLVVWQDLRNGKDWDVYASRVTPDGEVLEPNGILVSGGVRNQAMPRVAWDGNNFNVIWQDGRSDEKYEVYMARVSTSGTVLDPNGLLVATGISHCVAPVVAPTETDGKVFTFSVGTDRTFAGVYQFPVSPTTGIFVSDGVVESQPAYSLLHTDVPAQLPIRTVPLAIAKGGSSYLISWRTDIPGGRGNTRIANNMALFNLSGERFADLCYSKASSTDCKTMNPDASWDGNNFVVVWHERSLGSTFDFYESVVAAVISENGELVDSLATIAGNSSAGALEACVSSDPLSGNTLIAYEKLPTLSTVPVTIAYRLTNADRSKGYVSVVVVDSSTGQQIKTAVTMQIVLSGTVIASKESNTGVIRLSADSGSGYSVNIIAAGYGSKMNIPLHLEGGKTVNMTVNLQRLPIVGIDIALDSTVMHTNSTTKLVVYSIHSDNSKMVIDSTITLSWISRNQTAITVNNASLSTGTVGGEGYVVATMLSAGHSDSLLVRVVKPYQTPVYHWKLDENSGTTSVDASGNGNTVTLQGGTSWVSGRYANAVELDGVDNYLSTSTSIFNPTVFTLCLWFKTTSTSGGRLIGFGNKMTGASTDYDRDLTINATGTVSFRCYPGSEKKITSVATFNDGEWHHVAASLSSLGMRLFVDGQFVASDSSVTSAEGYNGYWKIGYSNTPYYQGTLDDIRVYGTGLSAEDVASLYTDTTTYSTEKESPLVMMVDKPSVSASPNPFNPVVSIKIDLNGNSNLQLRIIDIRGRLVADLTSKLNSMAFSNIYGRDIRKIEWNASGFPSGIYIVSLNSGGFETRKKIILAK
jgi:hypothetical protein